MKRQQTIFCLLLILAVGGGCFSSGIMAKGSQRLPNISVLGDVEQDLDHIPGAAGVIDNAMLSVSQPFTLNEALRKVSGVYVRDEDGVSLRPNISLRGVDGNRSTKVLLLEDGVPIALAPYGENSAYYAPQIDRLSRIEILKGSGSILYGPQTVGGVINYITKDIPKETALDVKFALGRPEYETLQVSVGDRYQDVGYALSVLQKAGNGPRAFSPYTLYDIESKLEMPASSDAIVTVKGHYHNQESASTYFGLDPTMYAANPNHNYKKYDRLYVERAGVSAIHDYSPEESLRLKTTGYVYFTKRHWWRQSYSKSDWANGIVSLLDSNGGRNREYRVVGIEPRLMLDSLQLGAKLHYEIEDYKYVSGSFSTARSGEITKDEERSTIAAASYAQFEWGVSDDWMVIPGLRVEAYKQNRHIYRGKYTNNVYDSSAEVTDVDIKNSTALTVAVIPGVGTTYQVGPSHTLFAGVHRGFSPAKFSDAIDNSAESRQLDPEQSLNYEVGLRSELFDDAASVQLTGFYTDYHNQIIPSSASSGYDKANAGKTRHMGLEADVSLRVSDVFETGVDLVPYTALSYISAVIVGDREVGGVVQSTNGKRLPYAPQTLATLGIRFECDNASVLVEAVHVGQALAYNVTKDTPDTYSVESANGERGTIAAHQVVNVSATLPLTDTYTVFGSAKNILNTTYIASRRPHGIFPGPGRQLVAGLSASF